MRIHMIYVKNVLGEWIRIQYEYIYVKKPLGIPNAFIKLLPCAWLGKNRPKISPVQVLLSLCHTLLCSWNDPFAQRKRNSVASRGVPKGFSENDNCFPLSCRVCDIETSVILARVHGAGNSPVIMKHPAEKWHLQMTLGRARTGISGRFQGVPEACRRLHANFSEAWRSLANPQRHIHKNLRDIHHTSCEGPSHSPEFWWRFLLYVGGLQNVPKHWANIG